MSEKSEVGTITVKIGSVRAVGAHVQDDFRAVEFEGEVLAHRGEFTGDNDTRGVDETLYATADGRLVVYVENWSRWQGEVSTYRLLQVTEADLQPGGRFELLGYEGGYGRPLTLDEALDESAPEA